MPGFFSTMQRSSWKVIVPRELKAASMSRFSIFCAATAHLRPEHNAINMSTDHTTAMRTLEDLFITELERLYDAESRMIKMLSTTAISATCWNLKKVILSHLLETEGHVMKLEQIFSCVEGHATGKTCRATVGLAEQGAEIAAEFAGSPALNAALISFLLKVEHQEIAAYTSLHEWAELLGHTDAAELIEEILHEETAAIQVFRELARNTSNEQASCRYGWGEMDQPDELNAAAG